MNLLRQYTPKDGYTPLVRRGKDDIQYLELGVLRVPAGKRYRAASEGDEVVLVLLSGLCHVRVGDLGFDTLGGRKDVFSGRATAVYIPPGSSFRVQAVSDIEAAIGRAPSDLPGEPRLIGPEKVKVQVRGKETFRREVHDIIDRSFPARRLLVGETFNPPGHWSSFPPHKHDRATPPEEAKLEEIYLYKLNPPQGFGFQRIYSPDRGVDEALVIRDNTVAKLPWGYHPVCAAPGYALYYLWILAGEERDLIMFDDPDHRWVKEG